MNISGVFNNYSEIKSTDKFQQEKCLVCMESFITSHSDDKTNDSLVVPKITRLACGHIFHTNCLANYIDAANQEQRNKCMICKNVFEINNKILTEELLKNLQKRKKTPCELICRCVTISFIAAGLLICLALTTDKNSLREPAASYLDKVAVSLLVFSMFALVPIPVIAARDIMD